MGRPGVKASGRWKKARKKTTLGASVGAVKRRKKEGLKTTPFSLLNSYEKTTPFYLQRNKSYKLGIILFISHFGPQKSRTSHFKVLFR